MRDFDYDQLKHASASEWFSHHTKNEWVPTLEDALLVAKGKIQIYLDNKDIDPQQLLSTVKKMEMLEDRVIYGGVDELEILKRIEPNVRLMPGLSRIEDISVITQRFQHYAFDVRWERLSQELIEECHSHGI